jgi:uncharacterized membrane protein YeaQ/YmgE (transglycosylase-associated protein family)
LEKWESRIYSRADRIAQGGSEVSVLSFLLLILIAGICGAIGQAIAGTGRGGLLVSIALGFIGALLGMWIAGALKLHELFAVNIDGKSFPIIWSIIGAALFVAVLNLISRRRFI